MARDLVDLCGHPLPDLGLFGCVWFTEQRTELGQRRLPTEGDDIVGPDVDVRDSDVVTEGRENARPSNRDGRV